MDKGIRGAVSRCVGKNYDKKDIHLLVNHSFRIALAYLEMKLCSHKSYFLREEKPEDLAMDFIADLFQRDENGMLIEICAGFRDVCIEECSESDITIRLRRIVFSKVDDNIFRFNGEKDPSLKKIIRNLKLGVANLSATGKKVYLEKGVISVAGNKPVSNKPFMPREFMQIKLCGRLTGQMLIPDILEHVADILSSQDLYKPRFPLVALGQIIRGNFVLLNRGEQNDAVKPVADREMLQQELEQFLEKSVVRMKEKIGEKYIRSGKVEEELLNSYFTTARTILKNDFIEESSHESQYEQLKKLRDDLDYDEFRNEHRTVLEYIVKLIRNDFLDSFKKEWAGV